MSKSQKITHAPESLDLGDPALDELDLQGGELDLLVDQLLGALEPVSPPAAARNRLMDAIAGPSRLMRFAAKIGAMADITAATARDWLRRIDASTAWEGGVIPGVEVIWIPGGPAAACAIRGFVRVAPGHGFPVHQHLGAETTLVLEGEYHDTNGDSHGPGAVIVGDPHIEHGYQAGTDSPLLMFTVAFEGIAVGDMVVRHRDEE